jgi:hypothetical protein
MESKLPFEDYESVVIKGFPAEDGIYFLILSDNEIVLTELHFEGERRIWLDSRPRAIVDEARIVKWKRFGPIIGSTAR